MKIIITVLRKNGKCRSFTNTTPIEHVCMALTNYAEGIKRFADFEGITTEQAVKIIDNTVIKSAEERRQQVNE